MTLTGAPGGLDRNSILKWLRENNENALVKLWQAANAVRRKYAGDEVHFRGLIEISNYCVRKCAYCGLRAGNEKLDRYRMTEGEILECARTAADFGYGTVVLQSGEDFGITRDWLTEVVKSIKTVTDLAVTLSMGERDYADIAAWREAGADRYLLKFETGDPDLYMKIHPEADGRAPDANERFRKLADLKKLGYECGSGIMIGIPGQSYESVADDILLFRSLDLDMIGVGPYLPHPDTPMGAGEFDLLPPDEQVPASELMTYKVMALTRLACPQSNIPATTALATLNKKLGRELGLMRGANVVMPNLTPPKYRIKYEVYPAKACIEETAPACHACLTARLEAIGRTPGGGTGSRKREIE